MENNLKAHVLMEQINNLSLSSSFKEMAEVNGFESLEEVLSFTLSSLLNKPRFTVHIYHELYIFLEKEGYIRMLKTE